MVHDREVLIFQSLGHPTRLKIIKQLLKGECSVTRLCEVTDEEQHRVSQLLAQMRKSEIVTARRESRQVYYSICTQPLRNILFDILKAVESISAQEEFNAGGLTHEAGQFSQIIARDKP